MKDKYKSELKKLNREISNCDASPMSFREFAAYSISVLCITFLIGAFIINAGDAGITGAAVLSSEDAGNKGCVLPADNEINKIVCDCINKTIECEEEKEVDKND